MCLPRILPFQAVTGPNPSRPQNIRRTDIRFASEKAILDQLEVGVDAVPGGGPMARLGRLVGRGRGWRSC